MMTYLFPDTILVTGCFACTVAHRAYNTKHIEHGIRRIAHSDPPPGGPYEACGLRIENNRKSVLFLCGYAHQYPEDGPSGQMIERYAEAIAYEIEHGAPDINPALVSGVLAVIASVYPDRLIRGGEYGDIMRAIGELDQEFKSHSRAGKENAGKDYGKIPT